MSLAPFTLRPFALSLSKGWVNEAGFDMLRINKITVRPEPVEGRTRWVSTSSARTDNK